MNFLAHSLFAQQDPQKIVGQFCGDFIRGNNHTHLPAAVQDGIRLHRQVDSFTDRHPLNATARGLFEPPWRRFAGIFTDVVYDHYLVREWHSYSDMPIEDHVDMVHDALLSNYEILPLNLQRFARHLVDRQVLLSYRNFDAVEKALYRISGRSPRFFLLSEAGPVIERQSEELNRLFKLFFPDLIEHMNQSETHRQHRADL